VLAQFHERVPTGGAIDAAATRDAVAGLWDRELTELPGRAEIPLLVAAFLAGRAPLFDSSTSGRGSATRCSTSPFSRWISNGGRGPRLGEVTREHLDACRR
jgi:hypothetical protein